MTNTRQHNTTQDQTLDMWQNLRHEWAVLTLKRVVVLCCVLVQVVLPAVVEMKDPSLHTSPSKKRKEVARAKHTAFTLHSMFSSMRFTSHCWMWRIPVRDGNRVILCCAGNGMFYAGGYGVITRHEVPEGESTRRSDAHVYMCMCACFEDADACVHVRFVQAKHCSSTTVSSLLPMRPWTSHSVCQEVVSGNIERMLLLFVLAIRCCLACLLCSCLSCVFLYGTYLFCVCCVCDLWYLCLCLLVVCLVVKVSWWRLPVHVQCIHKIVPPRCGPRLSINHNDRRRGTIVQEDWLHKALQHTKGTHRRNEW